MTEPTRTTVSYGGLLNELMSNTLDRDYATAAERRPSRRPRTRASSVTTVMAVVAVFGLMIGVSAIRTAQQRPAAQAERTQLVSQVHTRQRHLDDLQRQLGTLETAVGALQLQSSNDLDEERSLTSSIGQLSVVAGTEAVTGPGVSILTDDAPGSGSTGNGVILDTDLQSLVNALWSAGAEAIAINGHRLTSQSAVRFAGRAITVDYRSLTPPYTVQAVGDPATMPADLLETPGGQAWVSLQANFGIVFRTTVEQSMSLPAQIGGDLQHAHVIGAR